MEEVVHQIIHHLEPNDEWVCSCGREFWDEEGALEHRREMDSPETKLMNCIARQVHHPQPIEIIYEMRGVKIASGAVVSSPIEGRPWMQTNQLNAERSRVTMFGCPNCGHKSEVEW